MTDASILETNGNRHNAPCFEDLKVGDPPKSSAKNLLEQTYRGPKPSFKIAIYGMIDALK